MASYTENLEKIKNAVYGEQVRGAIHDTIEQIGKAVCGLDILLAGQPQSVSSETGVNVTFTVTAIGNSLSYQWQSKTGGNWANSGLTGNATKTLTVPVTTQRNGAQFRCVITDSNSNTVTSDVAVLTVTGG